MAKTKEFTVPLENKPGTLGELARTLAAQGVNIAGLDLTTSGAYGIARFVASDAAKAEQALRGRFPFRTSDVLVVKLPDAPGKLAEVAEKLATSGVNIEEAWGTAGAGAELVLRVDDLAAAQKVVG